MIILSRFKPHIYLLMKKRSEAAIAYFVMKATKISHFLLYLMSQMYLEERKVSRFFF